MLTVILIHETVNYTQMNGYFNNGQHNTWILLLA